MRSEFAANTALATRTTQAWAKPSTCRRPLKPSLLARLLKLITL